MKSVSLILLLFSPVVAIGQARPATCEVRPLWPIKGGARSANREGNREWILALQ